MMRTEYGLDEDGKWWANKNDKIEFFDSEVQCIIWTENNVDREDVLNMFPIEKDVREVPLYGMSLFLNTWKKHKFKSDDKIYANNWGHWIAVNNTEGECQTEYFENKEQAEGWLNGMGAEEAREALHETIKEDGTAKSATHYQQAEIEPIEIMQMYFTKEMFLGFLIGNVIKYALRFRFKGSEKKDISKMKQYAEWAEVISNGGKIEPRE